jgi:hypothetical protein
MAWVACVRPAGFWGLCGRLAVGMVVVGRNDYAVEVVGVVVEEGFGDVVVMAVVEVVVGGFGYAMELRAFALADGEYRRCIAFLRASLAPC